MANDFVLNAELRTDLGKGASRRLRHTGKVPAVMYGAGEDPVSLTLQHNELAHQIENEAFFSHILKVKVDGKDQQAIVKDLQRHPSRPIIMHMDLQRISAREKLKTNVPLHFVGEETAPGVKAGGLVSHELTEVAVECLPKDLPEYIEVDISALDIGDSIHLSEVSVPDGVTLTELARGEGHDLSVVSIHVRRAVEEEPTEAPAAEGEAAEGEAEGGEGGES